MEIGSIPPKFYNLHLQFKRQNHWQKKKISNIVKRFCDLVVKDKEKYSSRFLTTSKSVN